RSRIEFEALEQFRFTVDYISLTPWINGIQMNYLHHFACHTVLHPAVGGGFNELLYRITQVFAGLTGTAELGHILTGSFESRVSLHTLCGDAAFLTGHIAVFGTVEGNVANGTVQFNNSSLF